MNREVLVGIDWGKVFTQVVKRIVNLIKLQGIIQDIKNDE